MEARTRKRASSSLATCGFTNTRKVIMLSDDKGDSKSTTWTLKTKNERDLPVNFFYSENEDKKTSPLVDVREVIGR